MVLNDSSPTKQDANFSYKIYINALFLSNKIIITPSFVSDHAEGVERKRRAVVRAFRDIRVDARRLHGMGQTKQEDTFPGGVSQGPPSGDEGPGFLALCVANDRPSYQKQVVGRSKCRVDNVFPVTVIVVMITEEEHMDPKL